MYKVFKLRKRYIVLFAIMLISIVLLTNYSTSVLKYIYPIKFKDEVFEYANKYGLDPYLVLAIMKAESSFNPNAVSHKNAKGLMQITDNTGQWVAQEINLEYYESSDLFNPRINIQIGCWYLRWLIDNLGSIDLAIAAYNGGIGNVREWLKDRSLSRSGSALDKIPFRETARYVEKVKNYYYVYSRLYNYEGCPG